MSDKQSMEKNIFPWLVMHHYETFLDFYNQRDEAEPRIRDGRLMVNNKLLKEGSDNNMPYHGFIFLVDGLHIFDSLKEENMINDFKMEKGLEKTITDEYNDSKPLLTFEEFSNFLRNEEENEGEDGAYIYNSQMGNIVRVGCLNNNPNSLENFSLMKGLPTDFIYSDSRNSNRSIGTKTEIAKIIPYHMASKGKKVDAYQIKRSSYAHLGMGKVTHFDGDGLMEEFFFDSFQYDSIKIKGVYRLYPSPSKSPERIVKTFELGEMKLFDKIYENGRIKERAA